MLKSLHRAARRVQYRREAALRPLPSAVQERIVAIRAQNLTYLSVRKLAALAETIQHIEERQLPGLFVEAGCALGGSAILIAQVKRPERPFRVYDVFGMIPAPTAQDGADVQQRYAEIVQGESKGLGGERYYGYEADLYQRVQENLRRFGVDPARDHLSLIKGLLQETMAIEQPVAFAHLDVDWYDPVYVALERLVPRLVVGGTIVLDDYHDWSGCRRAADLYLMDIRDQFLWDESAGSLRLTRTVAPASR